jgi:hypothetical protein
MTQAQLDRSVARSTGESLRTVRSLGFHLQAGRPLDLEPEDLHLAIDCPRCGGPCPLPCDREDPVAMGECVPCDFLFDYRPSDVRVAG